MNYYKYGKNNFDKIISIDWHNIISDILLCLKYVIELFSYNEFINRYT